MKYRNPIIRGFNPDPSICRVGDDYYLVTSSFEYFPGIPVYHSRDLVNWTQIGNCISRPGQMPMNKAKASGGIWAPTIRYYEGTFYVTATFSETGNFIVSTKDPQSQWSDPIMVEMDGIDPSLFFESGKAYYCANDCGKRMSLFHSEGISLAEIDINTGKVIGEIRRIWEGTGGGFLEAPHIYHIGAYYYLLAAEGGTGANHMITVARSKELWGSYESYEGNPILTNRNDTSKAVACAGHGDLVEDAYGNWWIVHLGTRPQKGLSHLGRETFLMPVTWEKEWPVIGTDKKSRIEVEAPIWHEQKNKKGFKPDFMNPDMEKEWLFLREPVLNNYIRNGRTIILKPSVTALRDDSGSPTFMAVRQPDLSCTMSLEMIFDPQKDGDSAGIVLYLSHQYHYRFCKTRKSGKNYLLVEKYADDFYQVAYQEEIDEGILRLQVAASAEKYDFYASIKGKRRYLCSASTRFLSCELAGKCFTGVLNGIFAECKSETTAVMIVTDFHIE